jgi:hypothetical protein
MADATVSKTVGGKLPCRFESGLRHHIDKHSVLNTQLETILNSMGGVKNGVQFRYQDDHRTGTEY